MAERDGNHALIAFEREVAFILNSPVEYRILSNRLFIFLNEYQYKLKEKCFCNQLLKLGDKLVQRKNYSLAQVHGYRRCLLTMGIKDDDIMETLMHQNVENLTLQALLGDCICSYYIILLKDELFHLESSCVSALSLLHIAVMCMQAGLRFESLYWLVYNAVTLSYSLTRQLLRVNIPHKVINLLLWCCISMESFVPLMTIKYLSLRADLYTAVCASYYAIGQPLHAELFARRALDKIHQLAQIEYLSSDKSSIKVFSEATVKLTIMVFKRSVLESHKTIKSFLRPKVRPTIKDLLQSSWPRSPTEKLLDEMFSCRSAQFLAILESLNLGYSRPFERKLPQPVSQLDDDTIADVYQELFTAGVDLALRQECDHYDDSGLSLLALAFEGSDEIPFSSVSKFIHMCYQLDCLEVFSLLVNTAMEECSVTIKILSLFDEISKHEIEKKMILDKCILMVDVLISTTDASIDRDVILDSSLLVWNKICDVYNGVINNDITNCKPLLSTLKYLEVMRKLVCIFNFVKLYLIDPLLYGEIVLKYIFLLEASADKGFCYCDLTPNYDRLKLSDCLQTVVICLENINNARAEIMDCNSTNGVFVVFHTEIVNALWRLKVKLSLAVTDSVEYSFDDSPKPSPLSKERKGMKTSSFENSQKTLLTESDLREDCGSDDFQYALMLINLAEFSNGHDLLKEALTHLSVLIAKSDYKFDTVSSTIPPAPSLILQSPTMLLFSPVPFSLSNSVSYYKLLGCAANGINCKVRLNDYHLEGLGIEVSARGKCVLKVSGLKANTKYIFAVAAYDSYGHLLGDSIGYSTNPITTAHCYSLPLAWGYLCQSAYKQQNFVLASHAANTFWQQYVHPLSADDADAIPIYRLNLDLSNISLPVIHVFVTTIFIQVLCALRKCELGNFLQSFSQKQIQIRLVSKLQLAFKLSGWINNYSFLFQAVVICYTLLVVPMMQQNQLLFKVLLECHCILQELPDQIILNRHAITNIHHVIASLSYYLVKGFVLLNQKSVLHVLSEHSRSLLLRTLPSIAINSERKAACITVRNSSLGSMASTAGRTSIMSFTTQSSVMHDKSSRKKRRKAFIAGDDVADEIKTTQYRALEAYLISVLGLSNNEEIDFSGQEDPIFLHTVINTLPVQTAYKEVHKFKRRPQYLEYFVHLCDTALNSDRSELILAWSADMFAWLAKRNEILLSIKGSQMLHKSQLTPPVLKSRLASKQGKEECFKQQSHTNKQETTVCNFGKTEISLRPSSVRKAEMPFAVMKHRITRDDLSSKAAATLQNLLPYIWRTSRCRRKLRTACINEQPWRAQINIMLASCMLKAMIDKFGHVASCIIPTDWTRPDIGGHFFGNTILPFSPEKKCGHAQNILNFTDLRQLLLYYQRAVVLAYRGSCWILVSNACRGLCNALTILKHYLNQDKNAVSELYGLSLKTLYIAVIHLMELNSSQLSSPVNFIKQIVLLAIQVCYVNCHWEKTLMLAKQLSGIVNVDDILSPIIAISQTNLSKRIEKYKVHHQPIAPAAHLDIKSYSLYNKVGNSLGMTNVSFQIQPMISNNKESGRSLLFLSRKLVAQYLNEDQCHENVTSVGDVEHITDTYCEAIKMLLIEENIDQALDGIHELGNLMYFAHNIKSAGHWWRKGLKRLLKCEIPLTQWRSCSLTTIKTCCFVKGGLIASKLARYVHYKELDIQKEYIHLAAYLFTKFLQAFFCCPINSIDFVKTTSIPNGLAKELSCDYYYSNSALLLSCLRYVSQNLVFLCFPLQSMPVLFLYEFVAHTLARNVHHIVFARSYKILALTQLSLFSKGIKLLQQLLNGKYLPLLYLECHCSNNLVHDFSVEFNDDMPVNQASNVKVLSFVTETNLSKVLVKKYGILCYIELMLTKSKLMIQLASTCEEVCSKSYLIHWQQTSVSVDMTCKNIKTSLLGNSHVLLQKILEEIKENITGSYYLHFKIRCYELLAEIFVILYCYETATKLYLAALREIQRSRDITGLDLQMWLKTQVLLMNCLSQLEWSTSNSFASGNLLSKAIEKCETYGDVENHSQLLYIHGCKLYSSRSPVQTAVVNFCQNCINKLNSCPTLSQNGKLLIVHASLLMLEVQLCKQSSNIETVYVYNGLAEALENQVKEGFTDKTRLHIGYQSLLSLLAFVYLKAAHSYLQLPDFNEAERKAHLGIELCQSINILSGQNWLSELTLVLHKIYQETNRVFDKSVVVETISSCLQFDYVQMSKLYSLLAESYCIQTPPAREKSLQDEQENKDKYLAWCAIRMASHCLQRIDRLRQVTSELHNEELAIPIPSKLISEIPHFALLHLCSSKASTLKALDDHLNDDVFLFDQLNTTKLTWFSVLNYLKYLVNQCFIPPSSNDSLQLHSHHSTSTFIPRAQALFVFLLENCPSFQNSCVIARLPEVFLIPSGTKGSYVISPPHPILTASEHELLVLWCSTFDGTLRGFMCFNDKPIKSLMHHTVNHGIDVYTFVTTHEQLMKLYYIWNKVANTCNTYFISQTTQPLSRSPSRMKQRTLELMKEIAPPELMKQIQSAVSLLISTLQVTQVTPHVEPYMVQSIARTMKPGTATIERGEAYHFFKNLFQ